jgi:large subunit ribosomal protein L24
MRQVEEPLSVPFEVKLIDPYNNEPCDATWRYLENGEKIRVSKQSGREIPLTPAAFSTIDYFKKSSYKRNFKLIH